ncbi:c-type cytochrome [Paraburkholderia susongensis]|uniref:Cytochrome c, mono-and diheme variants n=1 Tax=Paraburkholderia susongensis TaxID=1515439 RepID=A0A1X7M304_9BURK|nr:c-type cytochrome [Paraburkholderia susongensis]SMG60485.1 Cytochrome c, mono-and diheme variants [Paraburkholderia susongensis]
MNRRRLGIAAAGIVVAGLAIAAAIMYKPAIAPIAPPAPDSFDAQLKREGARVVALGDCIVCHTAKDGQPFAGGLPLATPFGTIYATNITPDPQTGIGAWSEAAFARAVRHGISRDGHLLYPAFPYVHFTRMSDHDIAAAYAYLMSREPVQASAPANQLIFPLNFRPPVAFWNLLFLRSGPREADASQDAQWNRGKLLVDGLGHCASCHSPLNAIGGEKAGHAFDGGVVDGWEAPPLNALGSAAKPWTKEQLVTYLRTGRASEHGAAAGPMLPVTRDLATVPMEDVEAIATYILSLQKGAPREAAPAVRVAAREPTPAEQRGAVFFNASCAQCHGTGSPMQTIGERPALAFSTAINANTPRNAVQMILNGITWHGADTMNYMPAFAGVYDDRQIADLVAYIRGAYSAGPAWPDAEPLVSQLRKEDSAR